MSAASMDFSYHRAVHFCSLFNVPTLSENGKFKYEHLKKLTQDQRQLCVSALDKVAYAQLRDFSTPVPVPDAEALDLFEKKLEDISEKVKKLPDIENDTPVPWYKAPFVWIAKVVHSFFLWFQNTFCGRISSKQLLDKISIYRQNSAMAPSEVTEIENEILPELEKEIDRKIYERDEIIIKGKLAHGLLDVYRIMLALIEDGKREEIIHKAIKYSHVDGIDDLETTPFHVIIYNALHPYFGPIFGPKISLLDFCAIHDALMMPLATTSVKELTQIQVRYSSLFDVLQLLCIESPSETSLDPAIIADIKKTAELIKLIDDTIDSLLKCHKAELIDWVKINELEAKFKNQSDEIKALLQKLYNHFNDYSPFLDKLQSAAQAAKKNLTPKTHADLHQSFLQAEAALKPVFALNKVKMMIKFLQPIYEAARHVKDLSQQLDEAVEELATAQDEEEAEPLDETADDEVVPAHAGDEINKFDILKANIAKLEKEAASSTTTLQKKFDETFHYIQRAIDKEGKHLNENTLGKDKELNANPKLQMGKLPDYGLEALMFHRGRQQEKAELLKQKYLSAADPV